MIKRLKNILEEQGYSHWKIQQDAQEGSQLFFIGQELDISRRVKTLETNVTLYQDTPDQKERGKATAKVHPTQSDQEIIDRLKALYDEAGAARNPWFPLAQPQKDTGHNRLENSVFQRHNLVHWTSSIAQAVMKAKGDHTKWINSLEVFLTEESRSFMNSEGVEHYFRGYKGMLDLVVTAKNPQDQEAELHREYHFSAYEPEEITALVERQLKYCADRANAKSMGKMEAVDVVLRDQAIPEFFQYWIESCSAQSNYKKIHQNALGSELFSGDGDKIQLTGLRHLYNGDDCPFDQDGQFRKELSLIDESKVNAYHGSGQFSHYMDIETSGDYSCFSVSPGTLTEEQLYQGPYLEIISFSDFQMDSVSGEFGGEIRLAYYFDGTHSVPLSGGAISGTLDRSAPSMKMSDQLERQGNILCPQALRLKGVTITPAE